MIYDYKNAKTEKESNEQAFGIQDRDPETEKHQSEMS